MKTKDLQNLRGKELKEVESLLAKKKLELSKLEVKILSGKEKNLKARKNLKKEIAQIMTVLKEKGHRPGGKNR